MCVNDRGSRLPAHRKNSNVGDLSHIDKALDTIAYRA